MMTLRCRLGALICFVALSSAAFPGGGTASAQTGYPPGTSVPAGTTSAGKSLTIGDTITVTLCANFAAGAPVTVSVNEHGVLTKTPTNGCVVVLITALSTKVLQVGDPVNVAANCGTNTITATGPSDTGGTTSASTTINLVCPSTATTTPRRLAFTGTNVAIGLAGAFLLIVLGLLLVGFQRRRRQEI